MELLIQDLKHAFRMFLKNRAFTAAAFYVNKRFVRTDVRAPFRTTLRFKTRGVVRARITTSFDQVVTIDRAVRGC